jgi:hypothetical protein
MELRIKPLDVDIIAPSFKKHLNPDQGGSKIVVIGKPGCFGVGTRVKVYTETTTTKTIEKVKIGDVLVGDRGQPQPVLDTCAGWGRFYRIYEVDDNNDYDEDYIPVARVNEDHILTLYCPELDTTVDISLLQYCSSLIHKKIPTTSFRWIRNADDQGNKVSYTRFVIRREGMFDQYYGIVLGGNHRFQLADGSVVHNTGKTTLITSLLYEKSHIFPTALIMSGTEDSNGHYKRIVPSTFVYNRLEEKKIEDFVARQKIAKKHLPNPWSVLLLDDCTDEPKVLSKPIFQGLYKNGRHWKMWFILSLQYCMDIKPVIRTNIDGTFILRESNLRNRKTLWENYAGIIPDFALFCQIMDAITDDYTALYIHNATQSNRIEDCVFWYKAKKVPSNFRFGSRDFWRFHKQRFDENFTESFRF